MSIRAPLLSVESCIGGVNGVKSPAILVSESSRVRFFSTVPWRSLVLRVGERCRTACVAPSDAAASAALEDAEEAKKEEFTTGEESRYESGLNSAAESGDEGNDGARIPLSEMRRKKSQDWARAASMKNRGTVFQGQVENVNRGGLVLKFYNLKGFLPFSQLSAVRAPEGDSSNIMEVAKQLIGTSLPVKVIDVDRRNGKLVFSERQALWLKYSSMLKLGAVFDGKVTGLVDYGAFVDVRAPDGTYPAVGLVHIREMSWDIVENPRDVLKIGQEVKVKIIGQDEKSTKLALSIRQLQPDPLLETLDTLMPQEIGPTVPLPDQELATTPLPALDQICKELEQEDGITGVTLGRQAVEKHVVSQDLELWLSQAPVEDGHFTVLARAGRQVQELHVKTSLGREDMKVAIKRVTQKIP